MRVIIDARGYGHHPMEFDYKGGDGWLLHNISKAMKDLGHDVHVVLDGYTELYQDGISYWPETVHPRLCGVLLSPDGRYAHEFLAQKILTELWAVVPPAEEMPEVKAEPFSLVWMAGANRGLWHMRYIWPLLKQEIPSLKLTIGHNFNGYYETMRWQHDWQGLVAIELKDWIEGDPSISAPLSLGRKETKELVAKSQVFAYPCDPVFPNSKHFSQSVVDAAAAGCALLLTPIERLVAMEECAAYIESPRDYRLWADTVISWMSNDAERRKWQELAKEKAKAWTWDRFVAGWEKVLTEE